MLLSLRKNGLTSLFKEVRVFKVFHFRFSAYGGERNVGFGAFLKCCEGLSLSFLSLVFFWENGKEETTKKTRIFYPHRTPKIPGKEGENAQKNKEILAAEKDKEFQKNKERKDRDSGVIRANRFARFARIGRAIRKFE